MRRTHWTGSLNFHMFDSKASVELKKKKFEPSSLNQEPKYAADGICWGWEAPCPFFQVNC